MVGIACGFVPLPATRIAGGRLGRVPGVRFVNCFGVVWRVGIGVLVSIVGVVLGGGSVWWFCVLVLWVRWVRSPCCVLCVGSVS